MFGVASESSRLLWSSRRESASVSRDKRNLSVATPKERELSLATPVARSPIAQIKFCK